ncbi:MAG TPA: hypothetical protein PL110_02910 [Candidatus Eremiobacteraeota bacterium]|nr:MAG: hypothetical protein BWY64_01920 [bacterium ADurb.Bin363]HPZ07038.1 hypothetical protein [Candidatus Eremiobacteraeota bacterium]
MNTKTFNIKMPEQLHQKIKLISVKEKMSMKDMIVKVLEEYIKIEEVSEKRPVEIKGLRAEDLAEVEPIDFKEDALLYQRRIRDEW